MVPRTREETQEIRRVTSRLMEAYGRRADMVREHIMSAEIMEDLDLLRTYEKLLPKEGCNTTRINLAAGFLRRTGTKEVSLVLTEEKLFLLTDVGLAISQATDYAAAHLEDETYDPFVLEALNHLERADEVVALIKERKILDAETLKTLLEETTKLHTAINKGIL